MNPAVARRLAWSLFGLYALCVVATLGLVIWDDATPERLFVLVPIGFAVAGVLVATREPNAVGWVLLGVALSIGLEEVSAAYLEAGHRWGEGLAVVLAAQLAWLYLAVIVLPLLFPTGRLLSPRWRIAVGVGVAGFLLLHLGQALAPGGMDAEALLGDDAIAKGTGLSRLVVDAGIALLMVSLALSGLAVVLRLRRSVGRERQQLKLFAYVGALAATAIIIGVPALLLGAEAPGWLELLSAVGWFSALALIDLGLPVAIGIAILRHGLYDIDVVIKRTLVYGALTVTLVAAYLGLVLVLRLALSPVAGDSDLAVAGSTLAVAALFRPLRTRIQAIVDRRFYRSRYDAARTVEVFAGRLRDELDLESLGSDLRSVVLDTMHPAHVSLWLRGAS